MKRAIIVSVLEQIEKSLKKGLILKSWLLVTGYSRRVCRIFKEKCGVSHRQIYQTTCWSSSATLAKADPLSRSYYRVCECSLIQSAVLQSRVQKYGVNPNNYRKVDFWDLGNLRPLLA